MKFEVLFLLSFCRIGRLFSAECVAFLRREDNVLLFSELSSWTLKVKFQIKRILI